jgi:hypothetical protein
MAYQPKYKEKDLRQIARKCLSTETVKWEMNPVEFQWKPKQGIVLLHFPFDSPNIEKSKTWTMALSIEPFEIGHKAYMQKIKGV